MSYSEALDNFIDIIEGTVPTWMKKDKFLCLDRGALNSKAPDMPYARIEDAVGYKNRLFVVEEVSGPTVFEETTGLPGYWVSELHVRLTYSIQSRRQLDRILAQDVVEITKRTYHPNNWGAAIDSLRYIGVDKVESVSENESIRGYLVTMRFEVIWADPTC